MIHSYEPDADLAAPSVMPVEARERADTIRAVFGWVGGQMALPLDQRGSLPHPMWDRWGGPARSEREWLCAFLPAHLFEQVSSLWGLEEKQEIGAFRKLFREVPRLWLRAESVVWYTMTANGPNPSIDMLGEYCGGWSDRLADLGAPVDGAMFEQLAASGVPDPWERTSKDMDEEESTSADNR